MYYSKDKDKRKKMNKGTKRMAYSNGGVVQYTSIEDKVEKCTAKRRSESEIRNSCKNESSNQCIFGKTSKIDDI